MNPNQNVFSIYQITILKILSIKIILVILGSLYYGYIRTRGRNIWVKKIQNVIYKKAMKIDILEKNYNHILINAQKKTKLILMINL